MNNETKRKSISLFLIIFIILLIATLVIIIAKVFQKNDEENVENNSNIEISADESSENDINSSEDFPDITSEITTNTDNTTSVNSNELIENTTTANTTSASEPKKLTLNEHTYKIKESIDATMTQDNNHQAIQFKYPNYNYKIIFNTSTSTNFTDLKNNSDLKNYLESTFNLKITSTLKSGNLSNLNVILFSISDSTGNGYCVFTKLNDTEVAYFKLYDTNNSSKLISDLSEPFNSISDILASMEN